MPLTVNEARASFTLHGADYEPVKDPDWDAAAPDQRRAYWDVLGRAAFEAKLRELSKGIDIFGRKLQRVKPRSRPKHLRQSGRLRPPLSPHEADSRFQRLLDFKAGAFGVTLFWRAGWARIVGYHAEGGKYLPIRNVLGLTAASLARVKVKARQWWKQRRGTGKPVGLDLERFTLMPGDLKLIEGADFFSGFKRRPTVGVPAKPAPKPPPPTTAVVAESLGIDLARPDSGRRLVTVDVARLNAALAEDIAYFVGPGGVGPSAKPGAYDRAREFLAKARQERIAVEAPEAGLGADGKPFLGDGRHRWAALRDEGHTLLVVSVPRGIAAEFARRFGPRG